MKIVVASLVLSMLAITASAFTIGLNRGLDLYQQSERRNEWLREDRDWLKGELAACRTKVTYLSDDPNGCR